MQGAKHGDAQRHREHLQRRSAPVSGGQRGCDVSGSVDQCSASQPHPADMLVNQPQHMRMLMFRQGDAGGPHAVVLGGPEQQRAPTGGDVEQALTRTPHQLAADQVELGFLRRRKVLQAGRPVRTRTDAPRVGGRRVAQPGAQNREPAAAPLLRRVGVDQRGGGFGGCFASPWSSLASKNQAARRSGISCSRTAEGSCSAASARRMPSVRC